MRQITVDATDSVWSGPAGAPAATKARPRRFGRGVVLAAAAGLALSACSLHITKNGISGNIAGHSFSAASGALPAGFPSAIPSPANSRVIAGGGTSNRWDVAWAVTGSLASGTSAYEAQLRGDGYKITNVQTGSPTLPVGGSGSGSNPTTTTVTVTTTTFTASDSTWTVYVVTGSTTGSSDGQLKKGEFAINITAAPTSTITSTT
jgi:hypothetical protein